MMPRKGGTSTELKFTNLESKSDFANIPDYRGYNISVCGLGSTREISLKQIDPLIHKNLTGSSGSVFPF